jgi:hypothetical protein
MHMHCYDMAKRQTADDSQRRQPATTVINRPVNGELVVRWVTTGESPLLYVLSMFLGGGLFFLFFGREYASKMTSTLTNRVSRATCNLGRRVNYNMFRYLN